MPTKYYHLRDNIMYMNLEIRLLNDAYLCLRLLSYHNITSIIAVTLILPQCSPYFIDKKLCFFVCPLYLLALHQSEAIDGPTYPQDSSQNS